VGYADQPDFVNAMALVETALAPRALLDALLAIEQSTGASARSRMVPAPWTWTSSSTASE
jgi:2-amino-4-hydroxy-6-hydroxymethyldihydropteridine diphosphokinase